VINVIDIHRQTEYIMEFKSHGLVEFQATDTYQSSDSIRVIYKAK